VVVAEAAKGSPPPPKSSVKVRIRGWWQKKGVPEPSPPEIEHEHSISWVVEVVATKGNHHPRNQVQKPDFGGGGDGRERDSHHPESSVKA